MHHWTIHAICAARTRFAGLPSSFFLNAGMQTCLQVVAACARLGTHYVDITGEANFIRECIDRYDAQARASGALIVPACGWGTFPTLQNFMCTNCPRLHVLQIAFHLTWARSWSSTT
jgi:hypothetical protein